MTQKNEIALSGNNALTQWSDEKRIRAYFAQVINLNNSGEEFPVDLEMVWPLAYATKEGATKALKNNEFFI